MFFQGIYISAILWITNKKNLFYIFTNKETVFLNFKRSELILVNTSQHLPSHSNLSTYLVTMFSNSYLLFYLLALLTELFVVIASSVFWVKNYTKPPINARRWFFPITLQVVTILDIISKISKIFLWPDSKVAAILNFIIFPILLQIFLWRLFELFFLWKLTGEFLWM